MSDEYEEDTGAVLRALALRKNVLLTGPPGTGKSRLLNQVRHLFEWNSEHMGVRPEADIPLPPDLGPMPPWFPSHDRTFDRKVFSTVFDQNTKYRDFMRGLQPTVGKAAEFEVSSGTLYRACTHAAKDGNAALVVVDEINRGPALAVFGSALVGLEADKRANRDGSPSPTTQFFELLDDKGHGQQFALPPDLYILAAMNEADTSVEPLDVAFLRRFSPHRLRPRGSVLRTHFGLPEFSVEPPPVPTKAIDIYEALSQAWAGLNERIGLARGQAYELGHGALMHRQAPQILNPAADYAAEAWATVRAHLDEVFFGDSHALAELLGAAVPASPYVLQEAIFAGRSVSRIQGPAQLDPESLYTLLRVIAAS